jgi:1,4-dihydroxy-2-naphthoate octaprenyltransferase
LGLALPRAGSFGAWWLALRPRTLPAALAPIAAGTGVAAAEGRARVGLALLCLATALLLQIAANLANDVFDFERGADRGPRLGPPRAAQLGLLSPLALRCGLAAVLAAAAVSGLGLVAAGGWPIALAGALALGAAYAYTGGPWPLAYHGLGDLAVLLFFGLVGVFGTHWVQTGEGSALALLAALPVGSLATAVLAVNNLRDRESDARAGKRTLAVRMREGSARRYVALLLVLPFAVLPALVLAGPARPGALVPVLLLPEAWRCARAVLGAESGAALNARLARVARLTAAFGVTLGLGLALEGWR